MLKVFTEQREGFTISTDPSRLDIKAVHSVLSASYWKPGVSYGSVLNAANNSLNFGLYKQQTQIGYARVVSDFTDIAYLLDFYIILDFQRRGLGSWLLTTLLNHPDLQTVKWMLATRDAHAFYRRAGFKNVQDFTRLMFHNKQNSVHDD